MESCLYIIYWDVQREYRHCADSLCDVCKINKSHVKMQTVYELHSAEWHSGISSDNESMQQML